MIDVTPILEAAIILLATFVTAKVIPWLKSKTTAQQLATMATLMDVLVYAAEQIYGSDKAQRKLQYVQNELRKRGYAVDIPQIEAAVKRMNDKAAMDCAVDGILAETAE